MQKVWFVWSPLLYFNFKNLMNPNSSSFIRFQCTMHDWGVLFSESSSFYKLKRGGGCNSWGEPILQKVWFSCAPLVYFNCKSFMDTISSFFIRFQFILHDSGVLFSKSWNFYNIMRGNLISGRNQFCRMSELFGRPSYI